MSIKFILFPCLEEEKDFFSVRRMKLYNFLENKTIYVNVYEAKLFPQKSSTKKFFKFFSELNC